MNVGDQVLPLAQERKRVRVITHTPEPEHDWEEQAMAVRCTSFFLQDYFVSHNRQGWPWVREPLRNGRRGSRVSILSLKIDYFGAFMFWIKGQTDIKKRKKKGGRDLEYRE